MCLVEGREKCEGRWEGCFRPKKPSHSSPVSLVVLFLWTSTTARQHWSCASVLIVVEFRPVLSQSLHFCEPHSFPMTLLLSSHSLPCYLSLTSLLSSSSSSLSVSLSSAMPSSVTPPATSQASTTPWSIPLPSMNFFVRPPLPPTIIYFCWVIKWLTSGHFDALSIVLQVVLFEGLMGNIGFGPSLGNTDLFYAGKMSGQVDSDREGSVLCLKRSGALPSCCNGLPG